MNIKIDKFEHVNLQQLTTKQYLFGSQLYGLNNENSDTDILCIYKPNWGSVDANLLYGLPNFHQFQYTDVENKIDYIYTTEVQFYKNLFSGDSTINAEIVMFYNDDFTNKLKNKLYCYSVIKAYLGFAKRDLKQSKEGLHKLKFAAKGLHIANQLIINQLPTVEGICRVVKVTDDFDKSKLIDCEKTLREILNKKYECGEITKYPQFEVKSNLFQSLLNSNNIKEFIYN